MQIDPTLPVHRRDLGQDVRPSAGKHMMHDRRDMHMLGWKSLQQACKLLLGTSVCLRQACIDGALSEQTNERVVAHESKCRPFPVL